MSTTEFNQMISSWISAFGATIGAVGQTKQAAGRRYVGSQLWTIGKGIQGVGSAFLAILEEEDPAAEIGNWFISIGSSTVSVTGAREIPKEHLKELLEKKGIKKPFNQKTIEDIELSQVKIIGSSLQSIGAYLTTINTEVSKTFIGGMIQSIGALIEALGHLQNLSSDEKSAQHMAVIGGWLQSIGTILQALGATEENVNKMDKVPKRNVV